MFGFLFGLFHPCLYFLRFYIKLSVHECVGFQFDTHTAATFDCLTEPETGASYMSDLLSWARWGLTQRLCVWC